jgi:hypothetical protein
MLIRLQRSFPSYTSINLENQNYIGKIPDEKEYGVSNMMPDEYE